MNGFALGLSSPSLKVCTDVWTYGRTYADLTTKISLTCDQALFSFRSVKHSGGTGETKNRA